MLNMRTGEQTQQNSFSEIAYDPIFFPKNMAGVMLPPSSAAMASAAHQRKWGNAGETLRVEKWETMILMAEKSGKIMEDLQNPDLPPIESP